MPTAYAVGCIASPLRSCDFHGHFTSNLQLS